LTNFDTIRLREIVEEGGVDVVSNQVSFSLVDERPAARGMAEYCERTGIKLLCYGTLLGGLLSDKWLGKPDPALSPAVLDTASLKKYYRFIQHWGDGSRTAWTLFQELLRTCRSIADKKQALIQEAAAVGPDGSTAGSLSESTITISDVAMRWVLQQPGVGGVIVGARLGHTMMSHVEENQRVFIFELDEQDKAALRAVQSRGKLLPGDCGDEYRG
jgi:aryl-alcohol dehydrogenase-like predicted oxidoreductase